MSKIAVIYWSGTGNTEAMADLVANAAAAAGASVDKFTASEFNVSSAGDYTGFALGCPAMGAEQLEESEFEPMYQDLRGSLSGKPVGLFGSYGWGDGEWIRTWAEDAEAAGARLVVEPVMANGSPDGDAETACAALGTALANARFSPYPSIPGGAAMPLLLCLRGRSRACAAPAGQYQKRYLLTKSKAEVSIF